MAAPFKVAIVGGGLVGISLAIALKKRDIPFTMYELHRSFTEIGAGISLNPVAMQALQLIDPALGDKVFKMGTRNPPPYETNFFHVRYGAAMGEHGAEGDTFFDIVGPITGNIAYQRNELLKALADEMGDGYTKFGKKLTAYEQADDHVVLKFADGTEDTATILVACDGIHSHVRSTMFGSDSALSKPHFDGKGAYRAVIPMEQLVSTCGKEATQSTIFLGPNGYFVMYPVNNGTLMNCGAWVKKDEPPSGEWVIPNQKKQLEIEYKDWGDTVHRILEHFDAENTGCWLQYQYIHQPDSFHDGGVILIGDAAHAMPPHKGSGAGEGIADAYVLAEVLSTIAHRGERRNVVAALQAFEAIRKPRFTQVQKYSTEDGNRRQAFFEQKFDSEALEEWKRYTQKTFEWIWDVDLAKEAKKAKDAFEESLSS